MGSANASQKDMVVSTLVTPTRLAPVTTVAPTTQATIENSIVIPTPTSTVKITVTPTGTLTVTKTVTTTSPTSPSAMKNIVATAEADGRFTTLVTALKAADLNGTLSDPYSNFTVFAPTDDAFRNLTGSMDTLLNDPQGDLLQILLYHVVQGKMDAADLKKLSSVETLQGGSLPISVSDGTITADGATVIITDIECSNGVIHVVDTVMLPPA